MTTIMTDEAPAQERVLTFVEPLPGFEAEDSYTLDAIDDHGVLYSLRSVRDPGLRFVLTPAGCFFADYRPALGPAVAGSLGATDPAEVEVLLVLTINSGLAGATANLRAPIVVAAGSGRAMQVVLDDDTLPMRRPLLALSGA